MYREVIFIYFISSNCVLLVLTISSGNPGKAYTSESNGTNNNDEHLTNEPSVNGNNNDGERELFEQEDLTKGNAHQSKTSEPGDTKTMNIPHAFSAKYNGNTTEEIDGKVEDARGGRHISGLETNSTRENLPHISDFTVVEGDILIPKRRDSKNLVLRDQELWPDKTVVYDFVDSEFTIFERNLVEYAIQNLRELTCVRFVQRSYQGTYLRFRNNGVGCAAAVGYFPLETGIDIFLGGPFCFVKGKIQHEILHTLGFWHEHTRPDRDSYVQVFFENVGAGHEFNLARRPTGSVRTFNLPYDYGSIMHYSEIAFSKDGSSKTIIPLYPVGKEIIGQRTAMSKVDLAKINRLYKCPKKYYHGLDISGAYSTSGPISKFAYLPQNHGWYYRIGDDSLDDGHIINKFFNNSIHFSKPRPGADNAKIRSLQVKNVKVKYNHGI